MKIVIDTFKLHDEFHSIMNKHEVKSSAEKGLYYLYLTEMLHRLLEGGGVTIISIEKIEKELGMSNHAARKVMANTTKFFGHLLFKKRKAKKRSDGSYISVGTELSWRTYLFETGIYSNFYEYGEPKMDLQNAKRIREAVGRIQSNLGLEEVVKSWVEGRSASRLDNRLGQDYTKNEEISNSEGEYEGLKTANVEKHAVLYNIYIFTTLFNAFFRSSEMPYEVRRMETKTKRDKIDCDVVTVTPLRYVTSSPLQSILFEGPKNGVLALSQVLSDNLIPYDCEDIWTTPIPLSEESHTSILKVAARYTGRRKPPSYFFGALYSCLGEGKINYLGLMYYSWSCRYYNGEAFSYKRGSIHRSVVSTKAGFINFFRNASSFVSLQRRLRINIYQTVQAHILDIKSLPADQRQKRLRSSLGIETIYLYCRQMEHALRKSEVVGYDPEIENNVRLYVAEFIPKQVIEDFNMLAAVDSKSFIAVDASGRELIPLYPHAKKEKETCKQQTSVVQQELQFQD